MAPQTVTFPKGLKREASCLHRGVKEVQHPIGTVWMKKVRNIWWHTGGIN